MHGWDNFANFNMVKILVSANKRTMWRKLKMITNNGGQHSDLCQHCSPVCGEARKVNLNNESWRIITAKIMANVLR